MSTSWTPLCSAEALWEASAQGQARSIHRATAARDARFSDYGRSEGIGSLALASSLLIGLPLGPPLEGADASPLRLASRANSCRISRAGRVPLLPVGVRALTINHVASI